MSKIPEQVAYDAANDAYQRSWRSVEPMRQRVNRMGAELKTTAAIADDYVAAIAHLQEAEAETAMLLADREGCYHRLVAARGY